MILRKLKGYVNAVKILFPEIEFDTNLFIDSWNTVAQRRNFFENYASKVGFDSLVPENWYSQSKQKIKETKVSLALSLSLSFIPSFFIF